MEKGFNEFLRQVVLGNEPLGLLTFCEHCIFVMPTRDKFLKDQYTTTHVLDYIHSDL